MFYCYNNTGKSFEAYLKIVQKSRNDNCKLQNMQNTSTCFTTGLRNIPPYFTSLKIQASFLHKFSWSASFYRTLVLIRVFSVVTYLNNNMNFFVSDFQKCWGGYFLMSRHHPVAQRSRVYLQPSVDNPYKVCCRNNRF